MSNLNLINQDFNQKESSPQDKQQDPDLFLQVLVKSQRLLEASKLEEQKGGSSERKKLKSQFDHLHDLESKRDKYWFSPHLLPVDLEIKKSVPRKKKEKNPLDKLNYLTKTDLLQKSHSPKSPQLQSPKSQVHPTSKQSKRPDQIFSIPHESPQSSHGVKSEADLIEKHSFESIKKNPTPQVNLENLINGEITHSTLKISQQELAINQLQNDINISVIPSSNQDKQKQSIENFRNSNQREIEQIEQIEKSRSATETPQQEPFIEITQPSLQVRQMSQHRSNFINYDSGLEVGVAQLNDELKQITIDINNKEKVDEVMFNKSEYSNKKDIKIKKPSIVDLKLSNEGSEERKQEQKYIEELMSISSGQRPKSIAHSNRPWSHEKKFDEEELINIQISQSPDGRMQQKVTSFTNTQRNFSNKKDDKQVKQVKMSQSKPSHVALGKSQEIPKKKDQEKAKVTKSNQTNKPTNKSKDSKEKPKKPPISPKNNQDKGKNDSSKPISLKNLAKIDSTSSQGEKRLDSKQSNKQGILKNKNASRNDSSMQEERKMRDQKDKSNPQISQEGLKVGKVDKPEKLQKFVDPPPKEKEKKDKKEQPQKDGPNDFKKEKEEIQPLKDKEKSPKKDKISEPKQVKAAEGQNEKSSETKKEKTEKSKEPKEPKEPKKDAKQEKTKEPKKDAKSEKSKEPKKDAKSEKQKEPKKDAKSEKPKETKKEAKQEKSKEPKKPEKQSSPKKEKAAKSEAPKTPKAKSEKKGNDKKSPAKSEKPKSKSALSKAGSKGKKSGKSGKSKGKKSKKSKSLSLSKSSKKASALSMPNIRNSLHLDALSNLSPISQHVRLPAGFVSNAVLAVPQYQEDQVQTTVHQFEQGCDPIDFFSTPILFNKDEKDKIIKKYQNKPDWAQSRLLQLVLDQQALPITQDRVQLARKLEDLYINPREIDILTEEEAANEASLLKQFIEKRTLPSGTALDHKVKELKQQLIGNLSLEKHYTQERLLILQEKAKRTIQVIANFLLLYKSGKCDVLDQFLQEKMQIVLSNTQNDLVQQQNLPEFDVNMLLIILIRCKRLYQALNDLKGIMVLIIKQQEMFCSTNSQLNTVIRFYLMNKKQIEEKLRKQKNMNEDSDLTDMIKKAMIVLQRLSRRIAHFIDDHKLFRRKDFLIFQGQNYQKTILELAKTICFISSLQAGKVQKSKKKDELTDQPLISEQLGFLQIQKGNKYDYLCYEDQSYLKNLFKTCFVTVQDYLANLKSEGNHIELPFMNMNYGLGRYDGRLDSLIRNGIQGLLELNRKKNEQTQIKGSENQNIQASGIKQIYQSAINIFNPQIETEQHSESQSPLVKGAPGHIRAFSQIFDEFNRRYDLDQHNIRRSQFMPEYEMLDSDSEEDHRGYTQGGSVHRFFRKDGTGETDQQTSQLMTKPHQMELEQCLSLQEIATEKNAGYKTGFQEQFDDYVSQE